MAKARKRRRPVDPLATLAASARRALDETYQPSVGYLYQNGDVVRYGPENQWWYDLGRAQSSCFGSVARRLRGTWDAALHRRGNPVAALLLVTDGMGQIIWRHRINFSGEGFVS